MERDYAIDTLQREAERVIQLANSPGVNLGAPVETCPGWDFTQLVKHLANVYNWAGTIVEGRLLAPPGSEMPRRPEGLSPEDWLADRLDRLLRILKDVPDDAVMWNFFAASLGPPSFWWRRQLNETVIHRVDAEVASSVPISALEPQLAADILSELLEMMSFNEVGLDAPGEERDADVADNGTPGQGATVGDGSPRLIVHFHATDLDGAEWTIDTVARTITRSHAKGDVGLRGPAWALARWCWGRPAGGELEVFGDLERAEAWRRTISA